MSKCCLNCSYYYANPDVCICGIDKETILEYIAYIKYCPAFDLWWGAMDT